jgi:hypothetical protein
LRGVREVTFVRDKRLNELPGIGSVRFTSPWGNKAVVSAPGHPEWRLSGRVMFRDVTHVADQTGMEIATFNVTRRAIEYGRRTLLVWPPRQGLMDKAKPVELIEDGQVLATFSPRAWGTKPVTVTIFDEEFARTEPLLILLGAWGANQIAAIKMAAAGTTPAT